MKWLKKVNLEKHILETFNTLAANVFNARYAQANSITRADFDAKLTKSYFK